MIPLFCSKFNVEQLWIHVPSRHLDSLGPFRTRAHLRPQRDCGGTVGASAPTVTNVFLSHIPTDNPAKFGVLKASSGRTVGNFPFAARGHFGRLWRLTRASNRSKNRTRYTKCGHCESFLIHVPRPYLPPGGQYRRFKFWAPTGAHRGYLGSGHRAHDTADQQNYNFCFLRFAPHRTQRAPTPVID